MFTGSRGRAVGILEGPVSYPHSLCDNGHFCHVQADPCGSSLCRSVTWLLPRPQVSGYPVSHGLTAMAGSIYPGPAPLLDQTDSWNHRPQEISMWQPSVEVNGVFSGLSLFTDGALPKVPFISKS